MTKETSLLTKICENTLKYGIYLLVFLLPIMFLPWTSEVLDSNKQVILLLLVFISLIAWMVKTLISGSLSLNLNKTHIAVLIFSLVVLLSTLFSLDKYGSFWGWPRASSESFLTLASLALLYLLISNVFSKKEIFVSIVLLALSGFLAVLIGIFQLLGVFLPFNFAKIASFNTIGTVGSLGIFAAVLLPLLMILEIYTKKWLKIIFAICIGLCAVCFVLTNYIIVWWLVLAGCAFLILFGVIKKKLFDLRWLGLPMFFLVLALFFIILRVQLPTPQIPVEVYLKQSAGLDISLKTVKSSPLFGSGPGTFAFDFSKYKKPDLNQGPLMGIKFNSAGSRVLTVLATTGILGFASFLLLIATALFYGAKFILDKEPKKEQSDIECSFALAGGVLAGFISLVIACFFYSSNISLNFLFFFLIACFIGLTSEKRKNYALSPSSILTLGVTFVFILFFIFGLGLLILNSQRYMAEIDYFKGVSFFASGQKGQGISKLEHAVSLNPKLDLYLTELSRAYLSRLGDILADESLSDDDKNSVVKLLVNNSVNAAKMATDVGPNNVNNWSVRGLVYQNLSGSVDNADAWAITSYDRALELDPGNPYLLTQEGIVYYTSVSSSSDISSKNQLLNQSRNKLEEAISSNQNYSNALFYLGLVYNDLGQREKAVEQFVKLKQLNPNNASDFQKVIDNISAGLPALQQASVPPQDLLEQNTLDDPSN